MIIIIIIIIMYCMNDIRNNNKTINKKFSYR